MLTRPGGWRHPFLRETARVLTAVAGGVAVLVALGGLVLTAGERWSTSYWLLVGALGLVGLTHLPMYGPWFGRDERPGLADGGVVVPFSRVRRRAERAELAAWLLAGAVITLALPGAGKLAALVVAAFAFWSFPGDRHLLLTPTALTYREGRTTWSLSWAHARHIEADADYLWLKGPTEWWLTVHGAPGSVTRTGRSGAERREDELTIAVDPLGMDPVVVYWTLSYYLTHPEARAELADTRALERIAARDLAGVPAPAYQA